MQMGRQTVWLVTMLTLMVVLSAYYIVTGPIQPTDKGVVKTADPRNIDVSIKAVDQSKSREVSGGSEYFVGQLDQRNTFRSRMNEEWMKVLKDPDASKSELNEAQNKIEGLTKVSKRELVLEELIRKEGFSEAVVVSNNSHVDVVVQSENLKRSQAVKLIGLVKEQMNVAPLNISVAYRP